MHLGLIGGIGPAATEYYYRGLVRAYAALGKKLELTIVHADTGVLLENLAMGAGDRQAEIFLEYVRRLQSAGAETAVVTSLAGHFCIKQLEAISPLPLINAIPVLDGHFAKQGFRKVGLLGTQAVLTSRLYGGVHSAELVVPLGEDLQATHDNYIEIAKSGMAEDRHRTFFNEMVIKLCTEQGADAVALAGTDLFLVFDGTESAFPIIDCAKIHIDALVAAST